VGLLKGGILARD